MTDIAVELSRRATPAAIKEQIRAAAMERSDELKTRVRTAAIDKRDELSSRAKESVMHGRERAVEQAREHRGLVSSLGAIGGAIAGGWLVRKAIARTQRTEGRTFHAGAGYGYYGPTEQPYVSQGFTQGYSSGYDTSGEGYGTSYGADLNAGDMGYGQQGVYPEGSAVGSQSWQGAGESTGRGTEQSFKSNVQEKVSHAKANVGEKLGSAKAEVSEKLGQARSNVQERVGAAKERISGLGHRAADARGSAVNRQSLYRARDWSSDQVTTHPLAFAAAAFGLGMLASALFPVSSRERQLMQPAKARAREQLSDLSQRVERRLEGAARAFGSEEREESEESERTSLARPEDLTPPSLH